MDELERGSVYWLKSDILEWPIPPDVTVEATPDEMTVSEFFNQRAVTWAIIGVGLVLGACLILWVGRYMSAEGIVFLDIRPAALLATGFLAIFLGWILIGIAILLRVRNPPEE